MLTWFLAGAVVGCFLGAGLAVICLALLLAAKKADKEARIHFPRRMTLRQELPATQPGPREPVTQ